MSLELDKLDKQALRRLAEELRREVAELRSWARTETERADAAERDRDALRKMLAGNL